MWRCSWILAVVPFLMGASIWVGAKIEPGRINEAVQLSAAIADVGTNPADPPLTTALQSVLDDQIPAFKFEQTNIPADVCTSKKCEAVGSLICEKKPGFGSKGSNIIGGFCMTICAQEPVRDNNGLFWVAIQCP